MDEVADFQGIGGPWRLHTSATPDPAIWLRRWGRNVGRVKMRTAGALEADAVREAI